MLTPRRPVLLLLGVLCMGLSISGCWSSPRTVNYYLLESIAPVSVPDDGQGLEHVVGVGPVDLPVYLDRPQMVIGEVPGRLQLAEYHRWGEPLRDSVTRVMAENLAQLLPRSHLLPFPWSRAIVPDCQVEIHVLRFHVGAQGLSELKANWSLVSHNKVLMLREFRSEIPVEGSGFAERVHAQSLNMAALSREIASSLKDLPRLPP